MAPTIPYSPSTYVVKLRAHGTLRRVRVPHTVDWPTFLATVHRLFPHTRASTSSLEITYTDEDGDVISLSTTDELREALQTAEQLGRAPLVFSVVGDDMSDSDAASIASWRARVVSGPLLEEVEVPPSPVSTTSSSSSSSLEPRSPVSANATDSDVESVAIDANAYEQMSLPGSEADDYDSVSDLDASSSDDNDESADEDASPKENLAARQAPATKTRKFSSQPDSPTMNAFGMLSALFGSPDSPRPCTSRADRDRPHHPATTAQRQHAAAVTAAREREEMERRRRCRQRAMELAAAQERERQYAEYVRELERQRRRELQIEREREEREYRRALTAERQRRQQQEATAIEMMMMDPFTAMCRGSSHRRQRASPAQYISTIPGWAW
ncbi:hypothetical protein H9P43_003347 [Blastocladiella emersonii ATCC 22665]|nr:hypothetical protein H9P43_003347 [Blastocladiella emersonii ATCC 22665]